MMELLNPPPVFMEINPASLRALRENRGLELPLRRAADGKLTGECRKALLSALQRFLGRKNWQPRVRAICGISAHGVSLRKVALPAAGGEVEAILRLQIEKEFPLPPEELAWGWREIANGSATRQALVAAVRKGVIEDYAGLLTEAGANPEFTLSAFARELLCPAPDEPHAILETGRTHAELVSFENGVAASVKILPANGDWSDAMLKEINAKTIYVFGNGAAHDEIWGKLPAGFVCRRLEIPDREGYSAATLGLNKSVLDKVRLLRLETKAEPARTRFALPKMDFSGAESRRRLRQATALLVVLLILPYAKALLFKPALGWKLAAVKNHRQQFASVVEPELRFLQSLKQSQPPYLDALYLFSKAASSGMRVTSLSLNQRGDIALQATLQNAQQVTDFRSKLIASGFFANITVEEQTPVPNQQKVSVRMTAQWESAASRGRLKVGPSPDEIAKSRGETNAAGPPTAGKIPKT